MWEVQSERPELALITNHGYAGVEIPVGGAADTGGQNFYVNSLALALEQLGYRVTIFARGGFPFFESERQREGQEKLSEHVRYVYVPGGGDEFIRKEDIATTLDEQVEWLDAFVRTEADDRGCQPWEVYGVVNTHYWDAAVLGMRLVERWRADRAVVVLAELLEGLVPAEVLVAAAAECHFSALGESFSYQLGRLLLDHSGEQSGQPAERAAAAFARWADARGVSADGAKGVGERTTTLTAELAPALWSLAAGRAVGEGILASWDPEGAKLSGMFEAVDRHVWTPHSLGALKEENFRDKPEDVVRALKFCERRAHERAVCAPGATRFFAATSEEIGERLHTHFGVDVEQMFYFPPCVDRSLFRTYSDEELAPVYEYLAEASGVAPETLKAGRVVFETSRMDHTKRKDLLLAAFARLATEPEYENCYLFIGGGPEKSPIFGELREQLQATDALQGRACLLGYIPEEHLAPMFGLADVFASASEMEGFGMSAAQAAGAGTACVLSDLIPFAVQYVPDAAIVFPAGDEAALAEGLRRLLGDDADRAERAERLIELTAALDWTAVSEAFLEHLRAAGLDVPPGQP